MTFSIKLFSFCRKTAFYPLTALTRMKQLTSLTSKLLILGSIMALSLTQAQATTKIWQGGTAGTLNTTGNWNGGSPGVGDVAQFSTNTTAINPRITTGTTLTWGSMNVTETGNLTITSSTTTAANLTLGSTTGGANQTILTVGSGAGTVTIGGTDGVNLAAANASTSYTISNASTLNVDNGFAVTGGTTLNINGAGTSTFGGIISGTGTNVSIGTGQTTTFSAVNSYTGTTTVAGTLDATGTGTLNATSALTVNNGGTVNISAANTSSPASVTINTGGTVNVTVAGGLATTSTISLAGGSLVFGSNTTNLIGSGTNITSSGGTINASALTSRDETIGTLTLTSGVTTIDLGSGGKLTITSIVFDTGASLVIDGWKGFTGFGAFGSTSVVLGSTAAVDAFEAGDVSWFDASLTNGGTTTTGTFDTSTSVTGDQVLPTGTPVTPAPEPSTVFFGFGLLALLAWGGRQQILAAGRSLMLVRA